jgi:hypothetical protein
MLATLEDIRTVRAELQQFDAKQTDFAVRFHVAVVDANLRAVSEGHDDPIFRKGLAICVNDLAACVRNPGRGCGSARCLFCRAAMKANAIGREKAPACWGRDLPEPAKRELIHDRSNN